MSAQSTATAPVTEIQVIEALTALETEAKRLVETYRGAEAQEYLTSARTLIEHAKEQVETLTAQVTTNLAAQDRAILAAQVREDGIVVRANSSVQSMATVLAVSFVRSSPVTALLHSIKDKVSLMESRATAYRTAHAVLSLWAVEALITPPHRDYATGSPEATAYSEALALAGSAYADAVERHGLTAQALTMTSYQILARLDSEAGSGLSANLRVSDVSTHMATTKAYIQALGVVQNGLGMPGSALPYFILSEHYLTLDERSSLLFPESK